MLVAEAEFRRVRPRRRLASSFNLAAPNVSVDALAPLARAGAELQKGSPDMALELLWHYRTQLDAAPVLQPLLGMYIEETLAVAGEPPLVRALYRLSAAAGVKLRTRGIVVPDGPISDPGRYHLRSPGDPDKTCCGITIGRDWLQQTQRGLWQKLKGDLNRNWCLRCEAKGGHLPAAKEPALVRLISRGRSERIVARCRQALIETLQAAPTPAGLAVACDQAVLAAGYAGLCELVVLRLERRSTNVVLCDQLSRWRRPIVLAYGDDVRRGRLEADVIAKALGAIDPYLPFAASFSAGNETSLVHELEDQLAIALVLTRFPDALGKVRLSGEKLQQIETLRERL